MYAALRIYEGCRTGNLSNAGVAVMGQVLPLAIYHTRFYKGTWLALKLAEARGGKMELLAIEKEPYERACSLFEPH